MANIKTSQLWFTILAAVEDDGLRNIHDKQIIACELVFMTDDHNMTRSLSRDIFLNFLMLQLAMIVQPINLRSILPTQNKINRHWISMTLSFNWV